MSTRAKIITTITVAWLAALAAVVYWYQTHKVRWRCPISGFDPDEFERVCRARITAVYRVVDNDPFRLWLGIVTVVAAVLIIVALIWTKPTNHPTNES